MAVGKLRVQIAWVCMQGSVTEDKDCGSRATLVVDEGQALVFQTLNLGDDIENTAFLSLCSSGGRSKRDLDVHPKQASKARIGTRGRPPS
jgi:hypothetical protein